MTGSDGTEHYFDRQAEDLHRDNLVDKWPAVAPLFDGLPASSHIVECGAGTGLYTLPLLEAGHRVTAVDLSARSLEQLTGVVEAAKLGDRLVTVHGNFLDAAASLDDVDAVTFIKVLHHFPDRASITEAIRAAWTRLRPGGRLVVFEPNGASPMWPILFMIRGREVWRAERNTRLIRHRFLHRVLAELPGATVRSGFNYLVPGSVIAAWPRLAELDRRLVAVRGVRAVAGNVWFIATRLPPSARRP